MHRGRHADDPWPSEAFVKTPLGGCAGALVSACGALRGRRFTHNFGYRR